MTTNSMLELVTDAVIIAGVLAMLFHMNVRLALAALLVMPLYVLNIRFFGNRLRQGNRQIQRNYSGLSSEFSESISGIKIIKSFSLEKFRQERLEKFFLQDITMRIKIYTMNAVFMVISEFLTILGTALILFYGGYLVMNGDISVGQVVAFYTYVGYLYNPLLGMVNVTQVVQRGFVSLERLYEVLNIHPWPAE
jgi:subfamily B ATP-binding cassette protein MsbA